MAAYLYSGLLVILLAVPLVANWRRGFAASLATTLVALLALVASYVVLFGMGLFPAGVSAGPDAPLQAMQMPAAPAALDVVTGLVFPSLAVLTGAGLAAIWTVGAILRDAIWPVR
jgi:hypothetical protein